MADQIQEGVIAPTNEISAWLSANGFEHEFLGLDHEGVPILKVGREYLLPFATALYAYGFKLSDVSMWLRCWCRR